MMTSIQLRSRSAISAALLLVPHLACWSQKNSVAVDACVPPSRLLDNASDVRVIRRIADPGTHRSWLLVQDRTRSAAPARLVAGSADLTRFGGLSSECAALHKAVLIHAGDSIVVEEHTGIMDARLEAIALDAAAAGDQLTIRLKIGGRILRARAIAPSRAEMLPPGRKARQ